MMLFSIFRPVRPISIRFLSNQSFGDLSESSSKYHSLLLTSVLAAYHAYDSNPLQSFSSKLKNEKQKFNHLIDNICYSSVYNDNIKDVLHGGERMQVRYMVGDNVKEKILFVSVRGSETKMDWIQDAHMKLTDPFHGLPGKIHSGFSNRARQVPIEFYVNKIVNEGYRCVFTGHSLGGAVATLLAIRVLFHEKIRGKSEFSKNVLCVGFGTPAVGNEAFVKYVNNIYKENFHFYINKSDLIDA